MIAEDPLSWFVRDTKVQLSFLIGILRAIVLISVLCCLFYFVSY